MKLQAGKAGELYYKIFGNTALFDKGVCFLKLDYKEFSKITADFIEERQKKLDIGMSLIFSIVKMIYTESVPKV